MAHALMRAVSRLISTPGRVQHASKGVAKSGCQYRDIVNSLYRAHGLHFCAKTKVSSDLLGGGWRPAEAELVFLKDADFIGMEPDSPEAVIDGFQANRFAFQGVGEEHISLGPSHLAPWRDAAHLPMEGVFGFLKTFRIGPGRRLIVTIGSLLAERLMRTLLVVFLAEPVEAFLLAPAVSRW